MEKRIFYHDTDAGGIVYYGNYLKYLEEARTEMLEKKGLSVAIFRKRGLMYVVRKCAITYRSPARYGDIIVCAAQVQKITAAQLVVDHTIQDKENKRLIVEAEVTLACLNGDFKPVSIPDDLKAQLL